MRFLYKIYSGYDGFTPARIAARAGEGGRQLTLGWERYLDSVSVHDECWIYFHGPHQFENGVYVKGSVSEIDRDHRRVQLSIKEFCPNRALTDRATSARIEDIVSVKGRQVFAWPEEWTRTPECKPESCSRRRCSECGNWQSAVRIRANHLGVPAGLPVSAERFVPAYWVIPSRCYLWSEHKTPRPFVYRSTNMLNSFKVGEGRYAYPFALGIFEELVKRKAPNFDAIVPIPLSPDKRDAGEQHRTLLLARELGRLLDCPVRQSLTLTRPISKRSMISAGYSKREFEDRYYECLEINGSTADLETVLLVDDVCTHGSTLKQATWRLVESNKQLVVWLATAAQMIVKAAVKDESGFLG